MYLAWIHPPFRPRENRCLSSLPPAPWALNLAKNFEGDKVDIEIGIELSNLRNELLGYIDDINKRLNDLEKRVNLMENKDLCMIFADLEREQIEEIIRIFQKTHDVVLDFGDESY